jgi:RNA polymerase sigma-70 factor (ECF subfamily)
MTTERKSEKLIASLRNGDAAAFDNLFRAWKDPIYGYVLRMVSDEALAHDVTQEVFLRVMRAAKSYDHRGRLRQWLFTIASNLVMDHARRVKRRREVLTEEPVEIAQSRLAQSTEFSLEGFSAGELRETLQAAVDNLPAEQRSVLLLRQYGELSFKEIASLEGCSINTALSRMRYALGNLKKILSEQLGEVEKS